MASLYFISESRHVFKVQDGEVMSRARDSMSLLKRRASLPRREETVPDFKSVAQAGYAVLHCPYSYATNVAH